MYYISIVLVVLASVLMCLIVLVQNSKGGGLASSFASSNQIMGVRKTTDLLEKITWTLVACMVVFSVVASICIPNTAVVDSSALQQNAIENNAVNPNIFPDQSQDAPVEATPAE